MTDAYKTIWLDYGKYWFKARLTGNETCVEYTRADLARPMTAAEAAKVLETDLDQLMSLIVAMPMGRHRREALAKVTEIRALSEGGD